MTTERQVVRPGLTEATGPVWTGIDGHSEWFKLHRATGYAVVILCGIRGVRGGFPAG